MRLIVDFLKFVLVELASLSTYINAVFVGGIINFFTTNTLTGSLVPYIVPVMVQAFSKGSVKFKNRDMQALLQLPAMREAPVFIMNSDAMITHSAGLTSELLRKLKVTSLHELFSPEDCKRIEAGISNDDSPGSVEAYSEKLNGWYEIRIKPTRPDSVNKHRQYLVWLNDISTRKYVEDQLIEYATFVLNNPAPVMRVDKNGIITTANPAATSIFQTDPTGKPIFGYLHDLQEGMDNNNGNMFQVEEKIGSENYLFTVKKETEAEGIFIFGSNITMQKKIESDFEKMALFAEMNPYPVLRLDNKGKILLANQAARNFMNQDDLVGKSWFDQCPNCDAEIFEEVILRNDTHQSEVEKEGRTLLITYRGIKHLGVVHIYSVDITESKMALEEIHRLKTGIDQAFDMVVITDNCGIIQYINPSFEEVTGYTTGEAIGSNINILKSGKMDKEFYAVLWNTVSSGKIWEGELLNRKKDGSFYYEDMTITPISNSENRITNFVAIKRDATGRKELEMKLEQARREQQAFMRHELKNLLTPIKGYSDLLLMNARENLTEKQVNYCHQINNYTNRFIALTDKLKQLEDFERNRYDFKKTRMSVTDIIKQAIEDTSIIANELRVRIDYNNSAEYSEIMLDENLLPGVFINLIKNGIEHVGHIQEESERFVKVTAVNDDDLIIIKISNKGEPIPEERLKVFFEKFNSERTEKSDGTGLGTTYAKLVTEAHGGEISVDSNITEGTTLTLKFACVH